MESHHMQGTRMATRPELEERIHVLRAKGRARTPEESVELGRLLAELKTTMPPGDFYHHVLEVLHIAARTAQRHMQRYREQQGGGQTPTAPRAETHHEAAP